MYNLIDGMNNMEICLTNATFIILVDEFLFEKWEEILKWHNDRKKITKRFVLLLLLFNFKKCNNLM